MPAFSLYPGGYEEISPNHINGFQGALMVIYNAGVKENGGIFSQTQGWLVLAEALLGHGNRAYEYYCENSPAMQNDRAEIRGIEPYAYGQFTESKVSPEYGTSHVHWLTGTASTMMVGSVEGLLGIRPDLGGIRIAPSIPSEWRNLEINKTFRGSRLHIVVKNPEGKEHGFKQFTVNGINYNDNYITATKLTDVTEVEILM